MSVLLLGADYYGTLAAARSFGRAGIDVAMADDSKRGRALFSRYVREKLVHPPLDEPEALVAWLERYGKEHPGTVLYPPNDHLSWLFAAYRERLGEVFAMLSPPEETIITLLDKQRMHEACAKVGIDVPRTWSAASDDEARAVEPELTFPVLLKPRTQVFLASGVKGFIASSSSELYSELARFRELVRFHDVLTSRHPDIGTPMLQEYLTAAETQIFSMSGWHDRDGTLVVRAAMKVLQRPRKVGIGLCFEGRPIDFVLADKLRKLCVEVGYYGAFESEFICDGDARLLIDFNPRFYSQMGFDIARGLPLARIAYHAARGETARSKALLAEAAAWKPSGGEVYCHKTMLDLVLALQGMSGQMSRADVKQWRRWHKEHARTATDAVRDADDRLPAVVDAASWVQHFARHPRSFVRSFVLNR
ncbi:MAG: carbamoyl-phosphate synthase [Myxococcales bacterium]|nr:carbamoyl-phosphate synthase [Myxococcales bacterium]